MDDFNSQPVDRAAHLESLLGTPGLWPLDPRGCSRDVGFGLVEVFHDLVSRPRTRTLHSWNDCGWHYSEHAPYAAQVLYRWYVNGLLKDAHIALRLAKSGEDVGRLVGDLDAGRELLIEQATAKQDTRGQIQHAIAMYRGRTATQHDKRSAVITLAGVLEARRSEVKEQLLKKDERALFQIANEFSIRHQGDSQRDDYDPAFVDWIFWWYLATIELTDQLRSRA